MMKIMISALPELLIAGLVLGFVGSVSAQAEKPIRVGMVGLDTSHVIAFTKIFNDPNNPEHVPGLKIVAGFKGGSPDIESSYSRVDKYTQQLQEEFGVEIVDTVEELCKKVDVVMIEAVEGRPHLEYAKKVIAAGLPMFIDKPIAAELGDAVEIARLAKKAGVPWFGGSSLRWWKGVQEAIDPEKVGDILGCDAYSPCAYEPHHTDLYWYGVHGVEILYAAMGPGCKTVSRTQTKYCDLVIGVWEDGRIGTYRGTRHDDDGGFGQHAYGAKIFGSKDNSYVEGHSYRGLLVQVAEFFKTKKPPISNEEMLEILAFMTAADESKRQGGKAVPLPDFSID